MASSPGRLVERVASDGDDGLLATGHRVADVVAFGVELPAALAGYKNIHQNPLSWQLLPAGHRRKPAPEMSSEINQLSNDQCARLGWRSTSVAWPRTSA